VNASEALKKDLHERRAGIRTAHREGAPGLTTCAALTRMMDHALATAYASIAGTSQAGVAILAVGGYGRAELSPGSDTDIMVLSPAGDAKNDASAMATSFLHLLWDAGLDVGHSVRTMDEALTLHGVSVDAWASMLESRFICGNRSLAGEFFRTLREKMVSPTDTWFINSVFGELDKRHTRYGNSVKLLEPNIKNSAGGLRDLQTLFWLFRGTRQDYLEGNEPGISACAAFLSRLAAEGALDPEDRDVSTVALSFLFRTRHEMHYQQDGLHDTLDYNLQLRVAEGLGYGPRAEMRSVEVFMRDYYLHARTIFSLNRRLSHEFREIIEPAAQATHAAHMIGSRFYLHDGVLSVDPAVTSFGQPAEMFEAFVIAAEHAADLDFRLRRAIENSAPLLNEDNRSAGDLALLFQRILRSRYVAPTLHAMNELNVLGRYIPEFGELVAFFQHNVYHYFTADEHTLIAIANAEGLREQNGVLHEVFRSLRRKDVLYMSILLHDIAKPLGVADHEITGVRLAVAILQRLHLEEMTGTVGFLIRNHLLMEQTAFRRNIHDPNTIRDFASHFENQEELEYLFLLTYADLSALNINVWTEWKAALLQELYERTSEILRRNLKGGEIDAFHKSQQDATIEGLVGNLSGEMPAEHIHQHLHGLQSSAYVSLFNEDEIARHIQEIRSLDNVSSLFVPSEGYTEITIIAQDAPFMLSKLCGVLAANDATIIDATVFTRDDGIVIDRFRVSDASTNTQLRQSICEKIAQDLREVIGGSLNLDDLFQAHRRKWKRRRKGPSNPSVRVAVEFEDTPRYTIIDVYAPDSVGFLYRVTEAISRLGLDIHAAKIATRVDGIVDAFYVLDRSGNPVTDPSHRETVRGAILSTVKNHLREELA
jgi:[protein-PII] uridylyltransferase